MLSGMAVAPLPLQVVPRACAIAAIPLTAVITIVYTCRQKVVVKRLQEISRADIQLRMKNWYFILKKLILSMIHMIYFIKI